MKINYIQRIIEPNLLLLVWQPSEVLDPNRSRRAVGELRRDEDSVSLRYTLSDDYYQAVALGFTPYSPFEDVCQIYKENVLETFSRRLPPRRRRDYSKFLQSLRIKPETELSDFALLGYSEAYLPSDMFSLVNPYIDVEGNCQVLQEIAGFRYYMKDPDHQKNESNGAIFMDMAIGDPVLLIPEPENQYDPGAVMVTFFGKKIGHINRFVAPSVLRWLKTREVSAKIEKVTGTIDRPRVSIFIDVS